MSQLSNNGTGGATVSSASAPQIVVITGGSQGIGRGIAQSFLESGATVILADLKIPDDFDQWQLALDDPARLHYRETNVCDSASIALLADYLEEQFGSVHVLVNNAGIMFEKTIEEQTEQDWDRMMAVNLKAPFLMTKGLLTLLEKQSGRAAIVNIGSIEGYACNPGHTAYSASKGGVHGLTVGLAIDLGPRGIRVNAIAPGWINTDLNREYLESVGDIELANSELAKLHPTGSIGAVKDIGNVAVWLAGPASEFVAGELITVDGARTKKLSLPAIFNR